LLINSLLRNGVKKVVQDKLLFSIAKLGFWFTFLALTFLFLVPVQYLASDVFDWWDKLQHALAFGVLTLLGLVAYGRSPTFIMWIVIAMVIYGVLIEIVQALSGWRYGELSDWIADLVGVAIAWGIFIYLQKNVNPSAH
jgi:VanZ family protein